jgi:GNAT superfamily N-acetyltransferase
MTIPVVEGPFLHQSALCEMILRSLPDWFGVESSIRQYVQDADKLPTFTVMMEGETAGFLTLKQHNIYTAEIYVMGVLPRWHRHGLGSVLINAAENWLKEKDVQFLQVKTLADTHPDPGYARTRAFYFQMGFRPLEVIENLWGYENPCLLMIKALPASRK